MMKRKLSAMSQKYATALKKHLNEGSQASLQPASGLGRRAVAIGIETLDVARMHEGALATLEISSSGHGRVERAKNFFNGAIAPIEKTHRAALLADVRLRKLNRTLDRRTMDLAASNMSLQAGIARRKSVEQALKKSVEHSKKLCTNPMICKSICST